MQCKILPYKIMIPPMYRFIFSLNKFHKLPDLFLLSGVIVLDLDDPSPPEERDAVLHRVDDVADDGEDDEEADYYYGDDDVAFDHGDSLERGVKAARKDGGRREEEV